MPESITVRKRSLNAVIGVWHRGIRTFYVKRSDKMQNYPGLWSLLSIQYQPRDLPNPLDLQSVQLHMDKLSLERLSGRQMRVQQHLLSGDSDLNPLNRHVFLHLYEVHLDKEPRLNPDYYTAGAWLTPTEYEQRNAGIQCGLCLRLWSDYAWLSGLHDRPFVPQTSPA